MEGVNGPSGWTNSSYSYNTMGQVSAITYDGTGDVQTYGYNTSGELTSDTLKTNSGAQVAAIDYGYDAAGQETSQDTYGIGTTSATTDVANTYTYDEAGELTSWNNGTTTTSYGYDADGNRTCVTTDTAGCTSANSTYGYDARDELTSDGTNTYTYTADGNLATKTPNGGGAEAFTFNGLGHETQAGALDYTYDGLGRVTTAGTTALAYSGAGNNVSSDASATYELDPSGTIIADQTTSGPISETLTDTHDNLTAEFGSSSPWLTAWQTYDPLGNVVSGSGWSAAVGYQSGYTSNGQVNMDSRWYTPSTGQFNSADTMQNSPALNPDNANPYSYGAGSPLDTTDPTGHCPWCVGVLAGLGDLTPVGWIITGTIVVGAGLYWASQQSWAQSCSQGCGATQTTTTSATTYGNYTVQDSCVMNSYASFMATCPGAGSSVALTPGTTHTKPKKKPTYICDAACQAAIWLQTLVHDSSLGRSRINPGSTAGVWTPSAITGADSTGAIITSAGALAIAASCEIDPEGCDDEGSGTGCKAGSNPPGTVADGDGWAYYMPTGLGGRATGITACLTGDLGEGSPADVDTPGLTWAKNYVSWLKGSRATVQRCHLLGSQLGGSGDIAANLATCGKDANSYVGQSKDGMRMDGMLDYEDMVRGQVESGETVLYSVIPLYKGQRTVPYAFEMSEVVWNQAGQFIGANSVPVPNVVKISNEPANANQWANLGTVIDSRTKQDVPLPGTE